jgi:hypothetical protein
MSSTRTTAARLLLGTMLIGAAIALWSASGLAQQLAVRHEQIATFRDTPTVDDRASAPPWTQWLRAALDSASIHDSATRDYWHRRYDTLADSRSSRERNDPASQLIAANATFRQIQREADGRSLAVDDLDRTLQAYAGVLQNGGFDRDAAWNYEYIARLRDAAAKEKPVNRQTGGKSAGVSRMDTARQGDPAVVAGDTRGGLPVGPTVHGRPGTHPPSTKGEEFEMITPMDYGDREAQPEPTPGVKLPRKG